MTETEKKTKKKKVIETGYQNSSHSHFSSTFYITLRQLTSFAQESNQSNNSTHTEKGKYSLSIGIWFGFYYNMVFIKDNNLQPLS